MLNFLTFLSSTIIFVYYFLPIFIFIVIAWSFCCFNKVLSFLRCSPILILFSESVIVILMFSYTFFHIMRSRHAVFYSSWWIAEDFVFNWWLFWILMMLCYKFILLHPLLLDLRGLYLLKICLTIFLILITTFILLAAHTFHNSCNKLLIWNLWLLRVSKEQKHWRYKWWT